MQPINEIQVGALQPSGTGTTAVKAVEQDFANMLTNLVSDVNNQKQAADMAIQDVHAGRATNLHDTMIAMEQAEISLRFMVQVRNKAMEAYQEIMRMQV
jgi:flagellar hook-basal body complex protein FliE